MNRRTYLTLSSYLLASGLLLSSSPVLARSKIVSRATDELIDYDALGLAKLIQRKQISPEEMLKIVLQRIDCVNPSINFIATPTYSRAKHQLAQQSSASVFSGVPSFVKDMVDLGGVPRTNGSKLLASNIPEQSVKWIDAFEQSGLTIIGTTTVPEFASGFDSELFGQTHNPWDLDYSCVGSSSGSAAAVASGVVPLAHGTDGGGSNRFPSSACNTFGFKPSRARLLSGEKDGGHDLFKTNCAISRSVRDNLALFVETQDRNNKTFKAVEFFDQPLKKRLNIAYAPMGVKNLPKTVSSVKEVLDDTAMLLQRMGHDVEEIEHPVDGQEFFDSYRFAYLPKFTPILQQVMQLTGKTPRESGLLSEWTISMIEIGKDYSPEQIQRGNEYFSQAASLYAKVFEKYDVILTPVMPTETPKLGSIKPTDSFIKKGAAFEHIMSMCAPINPIGDCAMSMPLGFSKQTGMPVGSMFHAPMGKDELLYALAYELEVARPWRHLWAPNSVKYLG